jgi:DNA-binding CsgD family transcriptional regulator
MVTPKTLTPRELEIASLSARGMGEKDIANRLSISPYTVRIHVENIKRRLGAKNKTHAIAILITEKIIDLD